MPSMAIVQLPQIYPKMILVLIWPTSTSTCMSTSNLRLYLHLRLYLRLHLYPYLYLYSVCGVYNTVGAGQDIIWSVASSPDGTRIASCSADLTVRIWDAVAGKCLHVLVAEALLKNVGVSKIRGPPIDPKTGTIAF